MGRLLSPSAHDLKPQFQHCGYCDEVACIVEGVSVFPADGRPRGTAYILARDCYLIASKAMGCMGMLNISFEHGFD